MGSLPRAGRGSLFEDMVFKLIAEEMRSPQSDKGGEGTGKCVPCSGPVAAGDGAPVRS